MPFDNILFEMFSGDANCCHLLDLPCRKTVHTVSLPDINVPLPSNNNPKISGFQTGNNRVARFIGVLSIL